MNGRAKAIVPNFLDLYMEHVGRSEIPRRFHYWSAMALLASAASNRMWYEKYKTKLYPNIYVFLIAESGVGKNAATDAAVKFIVDRKADVGLYAGEISYLSMLKRLATKKKGQKSRMFLVTPELSMSLGAGNMADAFVKHMTELFSGRVAPFEKAAESSGSFVIYDPCVSWLAGTTTDWMFDSISPQAVKSGFFARVLTIQEETDYNNRVYEPVYPGNYVELVDAIQDRIDEILELEGQFEMTERAKEIDRAWYYNRAEPDDPVLAPAWRRSHEIILKLAMLLALADYRETKALRILGKHIAKARELLAEIQIEAPKLVKIASASVGNRAIEVLRDIVKDQPIVAHWKIAKKAQARGLDARQLKESIEMLIQTKEWSWKRMGRGVWYTVAQEETESSARA